MEESDLIQPLEFKVTSADTDMYSRLRLGSLVNMLIQSAILSADNLGFGHLKLNQNRLFWVLSRLTVKILKPVMWYDEALVETWPKDIHGLLYLRDFLLKSKGETIAKATSGWLAVDLDSKRPKMVDLPNQESFTRLKEKHALQEMPVKLGPVSEGIKCEVNPSYFDLDMNRHVTSTRYIDWMMDMLPGEYHKTNYARELSINYLKETMPDEILQVRWLQGGPQHLFEGTNLKHKTLAFRGKIIF